MIPILYEGNEQNFLHNGLGRLADAISCKVTEERNGTFELEMTYPITGIHYAEIQENRIIFAKTEDGGNNQAFIIYKVSKPLNGIVTINAQHISYLLNGFIVMPFNAVSCADAMSKIAANTVLNTPFEYYTDVASTVAFKLDAPRSIRGLLGGEQGSILDTYGGYDYKFDNFNVYLYQNRGTDNGVSIRYGKNLTGLKNEVDATSVYTGIVPYWADSEGNTVYLTERVVLSDHASDYPYKILKTVDFSSEFETQPTEAQLRAKAQSYITNSSAWKIKNSIDVSFINLGQTEEYKSIAALERVKLCDYVTVIYDKLGVDVKTKVIKTVYNVLTERYDTISLGDTTYTLAKAIQGAIDTPTMTEVSTNVKNAVARATKLIQGGLGGHVVFNTDGNGEPQEILIMDTDDMATAVNVIRMNLNGIGFSHNGYEGPFDTAWTIDGHFVADYIDTGNLNGNLIQANTISASALTLEAKQSLSAVHNYLGDIFNDISLWENDGTTNYAYETIDGVKYFTIDGNVAGVTYVGTPCDIRGNIKLNVHLVYYVDTPITITQSKWFLGVRFKKNNSSTTWYSHRDIPAQQVPANTPFTWDTTLTLSDVDGNEPALFMIWHLQGTKMYVSELTVTSTVDAYATSGMDFNQYGLSLMAERLDEEETHSYLPYDIVTNTDRWEPVYSMSDVHITHEQITVGGVTKDAICLDGTDIVQQDDWQRYRVKIGLIGRPTIKVSYKYQIATDYTPSADKEISYVKYYQSGDSSDYTTDAYNKFTGGQTYYANTEYTYTRTVTLSRDSNAYEKPAEFCVDTRQGLKFYIYDIEITSTEDVYRKATLKYTADGLDSTVQQGSVISQINQSAEQVSIKANKIDLTGNLSLKGQFQAFNPNDLTDYIDMTDGAISVYNNGDNVFTVSCTELLNDAGAGVFFGDVEDPATLSRYTLISGKQVRTPYLYIRADGSHDSGGEPPSGVYLNCEGTAEFHDNLSAVSISTPVQMQAGDYNTFYNNSYFYGNVYNSNGGTVFVSDKRKKKNIKDLALDKAKSFLMALVPKAFKYKDGTSGRYHHGFIAQEVKQAMGGDDWGVYIVDKERDFIGLRYDEIIADLVKVVQDQEQRISALERKIK